MTPEELSLLWETNNYFIATKWVFFTGIIALYALAAIRHEMGFFRAFLGIVGLAKVPNRDWLFNSIHAFLVVAILLLMLIGYLTALG